MVVSPLQEERRMAKRTASFDSVSIIQVVVAIFLFTLGLIGITNWNSSLAQFGRGINRLFGQANDPVNIIMSIIELAAGVIVFAALFVNVKSGILYVLTLIIGIFWIVVIILGFFARGAFEPNFVFWLNRLAADVIILLALWLVNRKYA
jgi:hypothetical protein